MDLQETGLKQAGEMVYQIYQACVKAGFEKEQALFIVSEILTAGVKCVMGGMFNGDK